VRGGGYWERWGEGGLERAGSGGEGVDEAGAKGQPDAQRTIKPRVRTCLMRLSRLWRRGEAIAPRVVAAAAVAAYARPPASPAGCSRRRCSSACHRHLSAAWTGVIPLTRPRIQSTALVGAQGEPRCSCPDKAVAGLRARRDTPDTAVRLAVTGATVAPLRPSLVAVSPTRARDGASAGDDWARTGSAGTAAKTAYGRGGAGCAHRGGGPC